jgi:hypothetical protein
MFRVNKISETGIGNPQEMNKWLGLKKANSLIRIKRSGVKAGGQPDRNRDPLSASETRNQRNISKKNCKL